MSLLDKITKFFDAAKDLAVEAVIHLRPSAMLDDLFQNTELIPVLFTIEDSEPKTFELRPRTRSMLLGAKSFMDPKQAEIVSIKQTLDDPAWRGTTDRVSDQGFDMAFFNTDEICGCPFDWGLADPEHPVVLVIKALPSAAFPITINMIVHAKAMPEGTPNPLGRIPSLPTQ